jgi:hypothetical protein
MEEMDSLVVFLNSLTGDNIRELVEDARSEPVGNPGKTTSGGDPRSRSKGHVGVHQVGLSPRPPELQ